MSHHSQGRLIVISGPSGAGKGTIVKQLFERMPDRLATSVSATTRPPRPGEQDGVDYHFLTAEEFARRLAKGEFIESFQVHGNSYGTLESEVRPSLEAGKWVILEIDVQGAMAVKERFPEALTIFIRPPTLAELESRLRLRGSEREEQVRARLEVARREMEFADRYDVQVVNDDVLQATAEVEQALKKTET